MNDIHSFFSGDLSMTDLQQHDLPDKQQWILTAARELFADQGYEETTIVHIAGRAGVAVGTVYLYFRNKHDILLDVCLHLNAEIMAAIQSPQWFTLPPQQVPRALIEAVFRTSRERMRYMPYYQVEAQTPAEMVRVRASKQAVTDTLEAFFRQLIERSLLAPFDTASYAALLTTLMSATLHQCFTIERGEREALYRDGVIAMIERLFFGPPVGVSLDTPVRSPITEG
jgi:AcrR family transcriptional regulator